jgi:hypothetical protein
MSREIPLTEERVREIMSKLKDEQRNFIQSTSKQSKKSKWLEILARRKGIVFSENLSLSQIIDTIDDWILQDVLDGGYGLRPYKCECGKPLRFQFIVHHTKEGKTYGLGETCFEHYTNLEPEILKDIKNGFYHIDLERDELLVKFEQGDLFNLNPYLHLEVPEVIRKQVELELPLTDKQISIITKLLEEHKRKQRLDELEQRLKSTYDSLNTEQKDFIAKLNRPDKIELLKEIGKIKDDYNIEYLRTTNISQEILKQIELGLPLLERQEYSVELLMSKSRIGKNSIQRPRHYGDYTTGKSLDINYETLLRKHLVTLRQVRSKEQHIPKSLIKDWDTILQIVRDAKAERPFDYRKFLILLSNLLIPLGIEHNVYE